MATQSSLHVEGIDVGTWCVTRALSSIHFAHDQQALTAAHEEQLRRLLAAMNGLCLKADESICLAGNADRAERRANRLAHARARAVKRWLVDHGISPGRVETESHGTRDPITDRGGAVDRHLNRRVAVSRESCPRR